MSLPAGIQLRAPIVSGSESVLTPAALTFVARLHRAFEARRQELLAHRASRQRDFDAGKLPDFLPETVQVRTGDWTIAPQPRICSIAASRSRGRPIARW